MYALSGTTRVSQIPLWIAAAKGHKGVVKLLLEIGKADINSKNEDGQTLL